MDQTITIATITIATITIAMIFMIVRIFTIVKKTITMVMMITLPTLAILATPKTILIIMTSMTPKLLRKPKVAAEEAASGQTAEIKSKNPQKAHFTAYAAAPNTPYDVPHLDAKFHATSKPTNSASTHFAHTADFTKNKKKSKELILE